MEHQRRFRGKFMSEKQYQRRMKQIENGKSRKKQKVESDDEAKESVVRGCRIIDLKVMAKQLYCKFCKEILSLDDVEKEGRKGLASILTVRCRKCLATTAVSTGKMHEGPTGSRRRFFDVNSKAVVGARHCGLGHTSVKKFLHVMDIPTMTARTFKKHEREIGPVVESIANDTCEEACEEERQLTIANLDK